jgi:hypothetical protein
MAEQSSEWPDKEVGCAVASYLWMLSEGTYGKANNNNGVGNK